MEHVCFADNFATSREVPANLKLGAKYRERKIVASHDREGGTRTDERMRSSWKKKRAQSFETGGRAGAMFARNDRYFYESITRRTEVWRYRRHSSVSLGRLSVALGLTRQFIESPCGSLSRYRRGHDR